jgi:hypothetical protein
MRSIFISYRRDDTEGEAGRLFTDLVAQFGKGNVFMDVTGIAPGRDFRKVVDRNVGSCGILLALIGKGWVDAKDANGRRRLDDPLDFVRLETASALKREIPVVPVLLRGASMPSAEQLPEDIKDLVYRNAVELTHARGGSDVQILIEAIRPDVQVELANGATDAVSGEPLPHGIRPAESPPADSAPRPKPSLRWKWLAASVVAAGLAAGVVATYEYRKSEKIAALEAAAREAKEREAAAKEAAKEAAAREASEKEAAAAKQAAAKEAAAREAAAKEMIARQAAAKSGAAKESTAIASAPPAGPIGSPPTDGGFPALASDASDPRLGTWKLNLAKSKFPGSAPKYLTRTYAQTAQGVSVKVDGVALDGSPIFQQLTFKYDGKDYPYTGARDFDMVSTKRVDARTSIYTLKKQGKIVGTGTATVSADGMVLTLSSDVEGATTVLVHDKQ